MNIAKFGLFFMLSAATGAALANQATLTNKSSQPISLVYRIAHKNPGQAPVYSAPQTVMIANTMVVPFSLNGYQLGGIVPVSINGVAIPASVTQFDAAACSLTTDKMHPEGQITFDFQPVPGQHGGLRCGVHGGISH